MRTVIRQGQFQVIRQQVELRGTGSSSFVSGSCSSDIADTWQRYDAQEAVAQQLFFDVGLVEALCTTDDFNGGGKSDQVFTFENAAQVDLLFCTERNEYVLLLAEVIIHIHAGAHPVFVLKRRTGVIRVSGLQEGRILRKESMAVAEICRELFTEIESETYSGGGGRDHPTGVIQQTVPGTGEIKAEGKAERSAGRNIRHAFFCFLAVVADIIGVGGPGCQCNFFSVLSCSIGL